MYCYTTTEKFIGKVFADDAALCDKCVRVLSLANRLASHSPHFRAARYIVASKVNPFPTYGESLTPESVLSQAAGLLEDLGRASVDILYLHAPDVNTPIEDTLGGALA